MNFWQALRKILRNIKDFEALLPVIVVTIFFQNYMNMKAEAREKDEKLKGIGHYAIEVIRDVPWPADKGKDYKLTLLQQANYFVQKGELVPLA